MNFVKSLNCKSDVWLVFNNKTKKKKLQALFEVLYRRQEEGFKGPTFSLV